MHRKALDHHQQHLQAAAKLATRMVLHVLLQALGQMLQDLRRVLSYHRVRHIEARDCLAQIPVKITKSIRETIVYRNKIFMVICMMHFVYKCMPLPGGSSLP